MGITHSVANAQAGWHIDPEARVDVQSPAPSFAGALLASHGFAWRVAAAGTPAAQEEPLALYPVAHLGRHVDPQAKLGVQPPAPPFAGALLVSRGSAWQVAGVSTPAAHDEEPSHRCQLRKRAGTSIQKLGWTCNHRLRRLPARCSHRMGSHGE